MMHFKKYCVAQKKIITSMSALRMKIVANFSNKKIMKKIPILSSAARCFHFSLRDEKMREISNKVKEEENSPLRTNWSML